MPNEDKEIKKFIKDEVFLRLEEGSNGCIITYGKNEAGKSNFFK